MLKAIKGNEYNRVKFGTERCYRGSNLTLTISEFEDASRRNFPGMYDWSCGAYLFLGATRRITSHLPFPSILPITPSKEDKTQKKAEA